MGQTQTINNILSVLYSDNPSAHQKFISASSSENLVMIGSFASSNPTVFKARPDGATNIVCYWTAEFYYAEALVICDLISNTQLKQQCKADAKKAYCIAFDECGVA